MISESFSIQRAADRAFFDHGWLQTYHSFAFAGYRDPDNENLGALRVFNDDTVAPGEGFGRHPHRDMEILTYVLAGELAHQDSLGNAGVVRPGGVQYLSAGTGVAHAEYNHSAVAPVHFVQMWVMPRKRNLAPRYGQVDFTRDDRRDRWLTIASGRDGIAAPIAIWQDAAAYVARIETATLEREVGSGRFGFLFVASGTASVNGEALHAGDAARIAGPARLAIANAADGPAHGSPDAAEIVFWDVP